MEELTKSMCPICCRSFSNHTDFVTHWRNELVRNSGAVYAAFCALILTIGAEDYGQLFPNGVPFAEKVIQTAVMMEATEQAEDNDNH